jgi:hypothetical protein
MDEELLVEEIGHYETLLLIQRRNLRALELQAARHGPFDVPLHIQSARDELRSEIGRLERLLLVLRVRLDLARRMVAPAHPSVAGQISFFATADLASTARFYGEAVGLASALDRADCRVYQVAAGAYLGFCLVAAGACTPPPAWPIATILTLDIDGWYAHLSGRGVPIDRQPQTDEPLGTSHFFVCDPNGYRVEIRLKDDKGL